MFDSKKTCQLTFLTKTLIKPYAILFPFSFCTFLPLSADDNYRLKLGLAIGLSLLATLIIMGGAIFAFLYWRKGKLHKSKAAATQPSSPSHPNRSLLRSLGNKFSGNSYKQTTSAHPAAIQLNGILPQNYSDFELKHYDNKTFEPSNEDYQNFTDFSGSREVGIDVGPFEDDVQKANNSYYNNSANNDTINIQITNVQDNQMTTFQKTVPIKPLVGANDSGNVNTRVNGQMDAHRAG